MELPVTVQYDDLYRYNRENDAMPDGLMDVFLVPHLDFVPDEMTEFMPCFHFIGEGGMIHCVIWSGRLMRHSFYVMNYTSHGQFLSQAEIAGFYAVDKDVFQRMAHIGEEGEISIVETNLSTLESTISIDHTTKWQLHILPDGAIRKIPVEW